MDQPLRSSILCPDYCKAQMDPVTEHEANVPMNLKHATQHASIIGNLERLGTLLFPVSWLKLIQYICKHCLSLTFHQSAVRRAGLLHDPKNSTFVDVGAGKGFMSLMLVRATPACSVILNDNGTFRLKADRVLRRMAKEKAKRVNFLRCRVDLKDFSIGGAVAALGETCSTRPGADQTRPGSLHVPQAVVGVGKHLCGVATDWALRSLFNQRGFVLKGFCLAPCCHQRCQWDEYVGKHELTKLGLCQREIELMFWMGSTSPFCLCTQT